MRENREHRDRARERVRSAGLRATPARVATLSVLMCSPTPITHSDVFEELLELGFDKATVFRNLTDMAAAGILRRTELGDRVWRFEYVEASEHGAEAHPHFICVDCGTVSCAEEIELSEESVAASRLFGKVTEILLRGHCNECS
ncbi:MAG: transcriptional repressor [Planctomycetota bacterium]